VGRMKISVTQLPKLMLEALQRLNYSVATMAFWAYRGSQNGVLAETLAISACEVRSWKCECWQS
jgi:hypothetical protein